MKLCDETITLFNARDDGNGGVTYAATVIEGASWHGTQLEAADPKGGLTAARRVTVRIPNDADAGGKRYADPVQWRDAEDAGGLWTAQGGDVAVRGAAVDPERPGPWTPAALKRAFADCFTILGVSDNRRAPNGGHIKITGT